MSLCKMLFIMVVLLYTNRVILYVGSGMNNRNQLKVINDWDNPKTTMPSNSNSVPDDFRRERQIRRIAKYRNNSYFVGSPESGVRFARLMSHFANIRKHNLDPVEYLCDVFCRIVYTNLKVYHFLIKKCTTPNRLQRYA